MFFIMDIPICHWPMYLYKGSHKRSHSLGEKEIIRSIPSPAPEQPFRDRSNTLNEKPALPIIRDKYKDLTGEVEVSHLLSVLLLPRSPPCWIQPEVSPWTKLSFGFILFIVFLPMSLVQTLLAGERAICVRMAEVFGERSAGNVYLDTHS